MNPSLAIVLVLLAAAVVMFALNKPRMDAVALPFGHLLMKLGRLILSQRWRPGRVLARVFAGERGH